MWKPMPCGSDHGSTRARTRSSWYGVRLTTITTMAIPAAASAPRWNRLAPAMKNMVTAVNPMTALVPRSGSRRMRNSTGTKITRNATVPLQNFRTPAPRRANQWAR